MAACQLIEYISIAAVTAAMDMYSINRILASRKAAIAGKPCSHRICGRSDRRGDFSDEVLRLLLGSGISSLYVSLPIQRPGLQARRIR